MQHGTETRVTGIEKDDILKMYPVLASLRALAAEYSARYIASEQIEMLRELMRSLQKPSKADRLIRP